MPIKQHQINDEERQEAAGRSGRLASADSRGRASLWGIKTASFVCFSGRPPHPNRPHPI